MACAVLLAAGLNAPALSMLPIEDHNSAADEAVIGVLDRVLDAVGIKPGEGSTFARLKSGSRRPPIVLTTLSAIRELFSSGNYVVGIGILCGSMLFPFIRLGLFLVLFIRRQKGLPVRRWVRLTEAVAKWCLLDVMLLAFVAASFSTLPMRYSVRLEWGVYLTAGAVFVSVLIPWLLATRSLAERDTPQSPV
ncbi:MAG: paraquat-inducible protein A [Phycisphaerae bacterium]|nr:paraquat-inducible protein A [Phycisphaerae bacterium]